jgi:hypothetical protein
MGRLTALGIAIAALVACDEPVGPQPDKPIKPPEGYTGAAPAPPGPPGEPSPQAAAKAEPEVKTPPAVAEPERPKCPADVTTVLTGKAKLGKDKKKRIELKLGAKANGPNIEYRKVRFAEDGATEEVRTDGAELTTLVTAASPKAKVKITVLLMCGWEDRIVTVTLDAKSLQVTLKEVPPAPEPGYLNVVAEPGTKVSTAGKEGKELGVAPLRNVPLAPGKYQLKLEPKKGKPKMVAVEIRSAQVSNVPDDKKRK